MRAVVTGGAGFIGSNLALRLEADGAEVIVVDHLRSGHHSNLEGFRGDVVGEDVGLFDVGRLGPVEVIFHQAAITDTTVVDQAEMDRNNVAPFQRLLDVAAQQQVRVVYASSAGVYGNGPTPMREDQELQPLNAYARSKVAMDRMAGDYIRQGLGHLVGLRYFNVFGPRERFKGSAASMIYQLAQQMRAGTSPRIFQDGEQKRDHIAVEDVVAANLVAWQGDWCGVTNVGTGVATTFNRLVEILNDELGTTLNAEYFENPYDFYQNHTLADTSRASDGLGWSAQHTVEQRIREYLSSPFSSPAPASSDTVERIG